MQLAFVYDSKRGATETVVGWMAGVLGRRGHSVEIVGPDDLPTLSADLIVIGSPIYFERPMESMLDFVGKKAVELSARNVAVFILGWTKRIYDRFESHIRSNHFGPLVNPIEKAVIDSHMFRGWMHHVDPDQKGGGARLDYKLRGPSRLEE